MFGKDSRVGRVACLRKTVAHCLTERSDDNKGSAAVQLRDCAQLPGVELALDIETSACKELRRRRREVAAVFKPFCATGS